MDLSTKTSLSNTDHPVPSDQLLKQEINKQKAIARAVVHAQEQERAEIGKELHDNVNQILSTAKLFLETAKSLPSQRLALIDKSIQSILHAIHEIRAISKSLVPSSIVDLGLTESINDLVQNITVSKTLKIDLFIQDDIESIINKDQKLMLFRIIQEQMNNVLKHSQAKHASIYLLADASNIELEISDDGKGFDIEKGMHSKKGVGLSNIVSRAELFHGKVDIYTAPEKGCKLKVEIPIITNPLIKPN